MEVNLIVNDSQYSFETILKWQTFWSMILDMCYYGKEIQEEMYTIPGELKIEKLTIPNTTKKEHCEYYESRAPLNDEEITFDHMWKQYSKKAGPDIELHTISQFKKLFIPKCLFYNLGVMPLFKQCFPNCEISYWEED